MLWNTFDRDREHLSKQYENPGWDQKTGLSLDDLERQVSAIIDEMEEEPRPLLKARLFGFIVSNAQIDIDPRDRFADRLNHGRILMKLRSKWCDEISRKFMPEETRRDRLTWSLGAFRCQYDFGHVSPDWNAVLELGIPGILKRIKNFRQRKADSGSLSEDQLLFYQAAEIVYEAVIRFLLRLAEGARKAAEREPFYRQNMEASALCLEKLAYGPPETMYEALQLACIFHGLMEEVEGERTRSLGGLDRLYYRFYESDLENGWTRDQEKELLKYFFFKFYAMTGDRAFGQPLFLGGMDAGGKNTVNGLSWLAIEAFDELSIPNPKIHIRVCEDTPMDFLRYVADCIRRGNSSFVFISDETAIPSLVKTGATEIEAREYVPIGCYEPAVMGLEVPCSDNGMLNLAKAVELALYDGIDPLSGERIGPETGNSEELSSFEAFYDAVKQQLAGMLEVMMDTVVKHETHYARMNPSPLFSATMANCVSDGRDAYEGGAKYNNSSLTFACLGSAVDSIMAVKRLVFDEKRLAMDQLKEMLENNWDGHESLRLEMLKSRDRWGNNRGEPDDMACDLSAYAAGVVNGRPNGRGGIFRSGLFSIDRYHYLGTRTGALPDGRKAHEPLSKNTGAVTAMDREGITALINSVTKIDYSDFANGSVLDIMLHPSAVQGAEGLQALVSLVLTFFRKGGLAIHANVFDVDTLRQAQLHPDEYENLQVRVCGWNVYFVNLSREEQDVFIREAEHVVS